MFNQSHSLNSPIVSPPVCKLPPVIHACLLDVISLVTHRQTDRGVSRVVLLELATQGAFALIHARC